MSGDYAYDRRNKCNIGVTVSSYIDRVIALARSERRREISDARHTANAALQYAGLQFSWPYEMTSEFSIERAHPAIWLLETS